MIRNISPGMFRVYSKDKRRNMGTYPSRKKAEERLKQIEIFKHIKK
jgi:hypothetical protein